jgi:hypothetical protein
LPHHGVNLNFSQGKSEFQANHFADGNLRYQHSRNSRLADVNRSPPKHWDVARIDPDVNGQLKPGTAASFHQWLSAIGSELTVDSQCNVLPDHNIPGLNRQL